MGLEEYGFEKFKGGDDYNRWKTLIRLILDSKDLLKIVDEEEPKEPDESFIKQNKLAVLTIASGLDKKLIAYVTGENLKARNIFAELDKVYGPRSLATQFGAKRKLHDLKMEATETMREYLGRFQELLAQLKGAGGNYDEGDQITWLTGHLPEKYETVIDTIQALPNENQTIDYIKNRLLEKEAKLLRKANDTSSKALLVNSGGNLPEEKKNNEQFHGNFNGRGSRGNDWRRTRRGRGGHRGSPRGGYQGGSRGGYHGQRGRNNRGVPRGQTNQQCFQCGRYGHLKNDCIWFKKAQSYQQQKKQDNNAMMTMDRGQNIADASSHFTTVGLDLFAFRACLSPVSRKNSSFGLRQKHKHEFNCQNYLRMKSM